MATITFSVVIGDQTHAVAYDMADADFMAVLVAYQRVQGLIQDTPESDPRERTTREVMRGITDGFINGVRAFVQREEQEQAALVAREAVAMKAVSDGVIIV